jgi:3-oxoadipate enol-lactonase
MSNIKIRSCNYYYEIHGNENSSETIIFSHGLLWSGKLFYKQVNYLKDRYRVVTYDHRGQGKSEVTDSGYDMDSLCEDTAVFIKELKLGKVHFAGLSMGGFVGMRLAARYPDLIKSLILIDTSAQDEPNKFKYALLVTLVKLFGVKSVAEKVMPIMFGKTFLNDSKRKEERKEWLNYLKSNQKTISKAVKGVISRKDVVSELKNIQCPVLILVGEEDVATIPAKAEFIHANIPSSVLKYIARAGHSSTIEEPEQVNQFVEEFLLKLGS